MSKNGFVYSIGSGTGFLPTNGIGYVILTTYNVFNPAPTATLYQDNVDLSYSIPMSIDYSFSDVLGSSSGTATVQILFTSNGTNTDSR